MTSCGLMLSTRAAITSGVMRCTTVAATRYGMRWARMTCACSFGLAERVSSRRANSRLSGGGWSSKRTFWARSPGLTCSRA